MKKVALLTVLSAFLNAPVVFAQNITVAKPPVGFTTIGDFVSKVLTFAFLIAILIALVMLIWGAFEWITSGGEKDSVASARNRIINALIGLAILAVAFALARVAAQFLGFPDITTGIPVPRPDPNAQGF